MEVKREIEFGLPPDEIWRALTDEEELEQWFANDVELDAVPGGEGVFRWDDGETRHALIEELEPERRFVFTWDDSRVVIELEEIPTGTRVTVNNGPGRTKRSARERRFGLVNHRCHRADYPLLPKYHET